MGPRAPNPLLASVARSTAKTSSTGEVHALLMHVAGDAATAHPFLEETTLQTLRQTLAHLPAEASASDRWELLFSVGLHELRHAQFEQAVSHLEAAATLELPNADPTSSARRTQARLSGLLGGLNAVQADYNNDGATDVLVLRGAWLRDAGRHPNSLLRNNGDGTFTDVTFAAGLGEAHYPSLSGAWADYDLDGDLDLYIGNQTANGDHPFPSQLFRNNGDETFTDVTLAADVGLLEKGHGVGFGDLDNDGDQDLLHQLGGAYPGDASCDVLFENPGAGHHWVTLKLIGVQSNRSAIGARIALDVREREHQRSIFAQVGSGGSFGANSLQQEIGLGQAERIERLEIYWPASGIRQRFGDVPVDHTLEFTEGEERYRILRRPRFAFP